MRPPLVDRPPIAGLVSDPVATAETREEILEDELFADEARALAGAVGKRRREFVTGRACARRALRSLGVARTAIGVGSRSEPLWPNGIVGSITHCEGYRAAAVARAGHVAAIGIDAEINAPLPARLMRRVASESELAAIRTRARDCPPRVPVCLDRLLFSAKEAVYKAWFPLTRRPLEFRDVELSIDLERGGVEANLLVAPPLVDGREVRALTGRWCAEEGLVCVAIVLPR
jgi:4'-phosphopantetheinyl transferase EntD